jgi:hypothetical protein
MRCCGSDSQKKSLDICVRLRKRASPSRNNASASLRCRNWPTWLPITRTACCSRSSGARTAEPEKASTPTALPSEMTAKAKAPCAAAPSSDGLGGARPEISPDQTGLPDCHTMREPSTKWSMPGSLTHHPSWKRSTPSSSNR